MADLGTTYDATNGETMADRSTLPPGEVVFAMVKSDRTQAKSNPRNEYVSCEFEILEGQFQGRRLWTNLNLWNDNSQAVEIAQRELNSIMHACGKLRVRSTDELHGIPMRGTVGIDKKDATRNVIKGYAPLNGGVPDQAAHQPSSSGASAPWRNRA